MLELTSSYLSSRWEEGELLGLIPVTGAIQVLRNTFFPEN